jgi:Tol biopolymer transport system component
MEQPVNLSPPLEKGAQLGEYTVLARIGAGGMGEVYKARDTRLSRDVAIKILPSFFSRDPDRLRRFEQEARAAAAVNHPNILAVHQIGTYEGAPYLVSELLEGSTLREQLSRGPMPLRKVIDYGAQIARGLAAAHEKGIVHRDLKPENLFVAKDGRVKILDFGLAKVTEPNWPLDSKAATVSRGTEPGGVMGTVGYMAPEQVSGKAADHRADIFAFGAVLYEMLTGKRAFQKPTSVETMSAILREDPPGVSQLAPTTPPAFERVVHRCLEKDPEQRFHSASDLAFALEALPGSVRASAAMVPTVARPMPRHRLALTLAVLSLALAALAIGVTLWLQKTEYFWRSPVADARFQTVTDFDGAEQAATVSRDGRFVAFLSNRDGQMDVWVTQVGSGQFHNLTHGSAQDLVNPEVRTLGFTPDGSFVTFWVRKQNGSSANDISIWAVPTLGGQQKPYLEGVAEFDWSRDASQLAYHTPGPGDPLFVSDGSRRPQDRPIFTAPSGIHSHFPVWAPDSSFIYLVLGSLPDKLDIWRITPVGGTPERITSHNGRVSHPVFLDRRTLMYLAADPDGSGPWLYSMDVERRIPHRLTFGFDRYTSLAASADGRRLVLTLASLKRTLWRLQIADSPTEAPEPARISLTTTTGFSPRLGSDYLLYVSATGTSESIWKLANGTGTELWTGQGAQILGCPAISPDGRYVAFSVRQHGHTLLYAMQADGTNARIVADSLDLEGAPTWARDGQSITSAAADHGVPYLFRVPINGGSPTPFVREYSVDPAWAPDGSFVVYSGPDIGTTFSVKAVTADAAPYPLPALSLTRGLTRGVRHLVFLPGRRALVFLRGQVQHKDLWLIDLETGAERQLTNLPTDFNVSDFDISPDGHEVVLERAQQHSDVVLLDLSR